MAFIPFPQPNEVVSANFSDLAYNYNTPRAEAEQLLAIGMTMDDIREYKRTLNGFGDSPLQ